MFLESLDLHVGIINNTWTNNLSSIMIMMMAIIIQIKFHNPPARLIVKAKTP